jgi:hypothetical protein
MKNHITSRDNELITVYLDNQLGGEERALFEARLKADAELRKELQEISKTRLLVRNLPKLRAPRNYFVQAKAAQPRPTLRLAPIFGIVSAVASVLLALVIFGSTFFSSNPQVVMAPMAPNVSAPLAVQQEREGSVASPESTTEAAPPLLMGAPILATPSPNIGALKIGQTELATPTTIYLYAYPPTSIPESEISIYDEVTEIARKSCEEYYSSGSYLTEPNLYDCPTPTSTLSAYLESILPTSTLSPSETPTSTPTATPTPTTTPTPIAYPSPTASPTPTPIETTAPVEKLIPPGSDVSSIEVTPSNQLLGGGNPVSTNQESTETPSTPNVSFLNYIVLTLEISLAAIAIFAGITAIILRIRAR